MTSHHNNIVDHRVFDALPKMYTTYANIAKSLLIKQNLLTKPSIGQATNSPVLPKSVYEVKRLVIDQANLRQYRKICGFANHGDVPITYFAVLSQTLQMTMMADEDFPFAMLGLVHIHNTTTQYRTIYDSETVAMRVCMDNLREHDKGWQFDFVTQVHVAGDKVWQGVSTYLAKQKKPKTSSPKDKTTQKLVQTNDGIQRVIYAPKDIGRQYARVSGDFNPIHLHTLSARLFGYPCAIAHGMWSKAQALSSFDQLPKSFSVSVDFKLPILLPQSVQLIAVPTDDNDWRFAVYDKQGEKPHLLGDIMAI